MIFTLNRRQNQVREQMKELSNYEPDSLKRYTEGVADIEPPGYKLMKGIVEPKLTEVTISDRAKKFDFGNVVYTSDVVFHIQLRIEKGKVQAIKSSPLEQEPYGPRTSTIPHHVAEDITNAITRWYQTILNCVDNINHIRKYSYTLLSPKSRIALAGNPAKEIALSEAELVV